MTFTPNLPKAVLDELQALTSAGVEFSQETLMGLASFVDDIQAELDRVKAEQEEQQNTVMASLYNINGDASGGGDDNGSE